MTRLVHCGMWRIPYGSSLTGVAAVLVGVQVQPRSARAPTSCNGQKGYENVISEQLSITQTRQRSSGPTIDGCLKVFPPMMHARFDVKFAISGQHRPFGTQTLLNTLSGLAPGEGRMIKRTVMKKRKYKIPFVTYVRHGTKSKKNRTDRASWKR